MSARRTAPLVATVAAVHGVRYVTRVWSVQGRHRRRNESNYNDRTTRRDTSYLPRTDSAYLLHRTILIYQLCVWCYIWASSGGVRRLNITPFTVLQLVNVCLKHFRILVAYQRLRGEDALLLQATLVTLAA